MHFYLMGQKMLRSRLKASIGRGGSKTGLGAIVGLAGVLACWSGSASASMYDWSVNTNATPAAATLVTAAVNSVGVDVTSLTGTFEGAVTGIIAGVVERGLTFKATAVPEPTSLMLLATGLAGLGVARLLAGRGQVRRRAPNLGASI